MLENLLFILGILLYLGIFLNFLRTSFKGCGWNPAIFDFLFVIFSIFGFLYPNPEQLEPSSRIVIEQLRCGESSKKLNFAQKIVAYFIPNKPQPQCPVSPERSGTGRLNFARSSGNGNAGASGGSNARSQTTPPSDKWNSDKDFYRYDKNQNPENKNKDDEIGTCDLEDNPVRIVNEEDLSYVKRITNKAFLNNAVKTDYERIKTRLENGVHPKDINSKKSISLGKDFYLIKGSYGRYVVEYKEGSNVVNVVGIADRKNKQNIKSWKTAMKNLYGLELKY